MIPPGPPFMTPTYSIEDDDSGISADSSIHESDYESEDSSSQEGFREVSGRIGVGDDTSTISKSSLASMSLSTVGNINAPQLSPTVELLRASDTSSSSSSGDDGWKTESSSTSNLSSTGDNSSKYDEARRHLQSRQKLRRTISNSTGTRFERPIDVESLKRHHSKAQPNNKLAAATITRQRLGFEETDSLSQANVPSEQGHRIIGFATAAGRKHMLQGSNGSRPLASMPQEIPVPSQADDVSTIGGFIPSYQDLVRMTSQRKGATDIEKGNGQTTARIDPSGQLVSRRSDFEMFLIVVIAASLVTLVVLLGLVLKTRG